jgi:hypothetical protein
VQGALARRDVGSFHAIFVASNFSQNGKPHNALAAVSKQIFGMSDIVRLITAVICSLSAFNEGLRDDTIE